MEEEIRNAPQQEGQEPQLKVGSVERLIESGQHIHLPYFCQSVEQVEAEMRQRIHTMKSEIYMKTQDAVHKRWVYEAEIKRPYFHYKPLDDAQLRNWRRYLDFEEAAGDFSRICFLYERCLVACVSIHVSCVIGPDVSLN